MTTPLSEKRRSLLNSNWPDELKIRETELTRRCSKCDRDLAIEPAIEGRRGILCFPCRYKLDEAGGEYYLSETELYPRLDAKWQAEFGKQQETLSRRTGKLGHILGDIVFFVITKWLDHPPRPKRPEKDDKVLRSWPKLFFDRNIEADVNSEFVYFKPGYPPDWDERREKCLRRDGHCCRLCGRKREFYILHTHHVILIARGGSHSLQNLIILCEKCHEDQGYYGHNYKSCHSRSCSPSEVQVKGVEQIEFKF
jgi:hypothetical protein